MSFLLPLTKTNNKKYLSGKHLNHHLCIRLMLRSVSPSWAKLFPSAHILDKFHQ